MAVPATASARDFTKCCFRVQASNTGAVESNYGNDQKGSHDGTHDVRWSWTSRELMEYSVIDGVQELSPACVPDRCSPVKGKALLRESSHFIDYPGDPTLRHDRGSCTNQVTTRGGQEPGWIKAKTSAVNLLPARSNDAGRNMLDLDASMVNLGSDMWDEDCWFGIGSHAADGHEHGEDPFNEFANNEAWGGYLDAPAPALFRQRDRFPVVKFIDFDHGPSSPESQQDDPHQTLVGGILEVRFTPFPESKLPQEIEKLKRLK